MSGTKRGDIDRKFVVRAWSRNSGAHYDEGNSVLFLARDTALPATLRAYRTECERLGAGELQLQAVDALLGRVEKFQQQNPTRVADVVPGLEATLLLEEVA